MRFPIRVHAVPRLAAPIADDEALGEALVGLVRGALARGGAPAVATVARPDRIEVIGLKSVVDHGVPVHAFLAGLTRATFEPDPGDARAVGLMGTVHHRRPGVSPVPVVVVFLEWPDCRWWEWRALLDPATGAVKPETETVRRAIDGDALPDGLGRWWSLGRRQPGRVHVAAAPKEAEIVH